jgi:hypothetical protein
MTEISQDHGVSLEQAEAALHEDHQGLHGLFTEFEAAPDRANLEPMLGQLHQRLKAHFNREQFPGGFYDRLGLVNHTFAQRVGDLVDEHYRLLSRVKSLHQTVQGGTAEIPQVNDDIRQVLAQLRQHEAIEHQLAQEARRAKGQEY